MVAAFTGEMHELTAWTRSLSEYLDFYRGSRTMLVKDPGAPVYIYIFGGGGEDLYVGVTRNPRLRFAQHRRRRWWHHVEYAVVHRIDCRWHDGPPCSTTELDLAARRLEAWLIELFEPTENRVLGPVS